MFCTLNPLFKFKKKQYIDNYYQIQPKEFCILCEFNTNFNLRLKLIYFFSLHTKKSFLGKLPSSNSSITIFENPFNKLLTFSFEKK